MEEALQPLETDQQTGPPNYFVLGIAASVALHLACTALLLALPQGPATRQSVTYVDLRLPQQHAVAMTPPSQAPKPVPQPPQPHPAAETPPAETPTAPEPAPLSQQAKPLPEQPPAPATAQVAQEPSRTTLGMGLTRGYFKSLGDGETLREGVKGYYQELLQKVNEKWWLDQQIDKRQVAPLIINLVVARNGEIVDTQIMASSGNPRYDRVVQTALAAAGPLPPLPATFDGNFFEAPIRLVPPLNLMAW